jgi:hypothetical protein
MEAFPRERHLLGVFAARGVLRERSSERDWFGTEFLAGGVQ